MSKIQIRKASLGDMSDIHRLVYELAHYEKAPQEMTTTVEEYQQDFSDGIFDSIVAIQDNQITGMVLYYMTYSTWKGKMLYLEDFVVTETYRRTGVGQVLFDALLQEAKSLGTKLVKWQVLDWNTPALEFYKKNKAIIETEWWTGKIIFEEKSA